MDNDINNNCGFYKSLDENFSIACDLAECDFTHDELLDMLKTGNIPQKQIAALKFDYVESKDDTLVLLSNLTGCDGKIREAVAFKINSLLNSQPACAVYFAKQSADVFANATIDINANICRLVLESAYLLKPYDDFSLKYAENIVNHAVNALNELDKFNLKDKKYTINKQIFKLYWCLDALSFFYNFVQKSTLEYIVRKSAVQSEYTIREKVAKIISISCQFEDLKINLLTDENYYVRQMLRH